MAKCLLCKSDDKDDIAYGELLRKGEIVVHEFCLYLSSGLVQTGEDDEGLLGFLPENIKHESIRVQKLYCCYCHKNYANIGCCKAKCQHTFHMICGLKNGAVNEFFGSFRSFCDKHVPKMRRQHPAINEICCICYDTLRVANGRNYYVNMIKAPCCNNGWFHKNCLQGFARSAGYFFKCPLCNDTDKFRERMPYFGVFIRNRDAAWELEPNAFAELLQRPNKCEAEKCLHKNGREDVDDKRNPLLCCETCGGVAVHKLCLSIRTKNFHCAECLQVIESVPSVSEGDSGSGSLQDGDDDEEIDVCYISDTEDEKPNLTSITGQVSLKKNHINVISDSSEDDDDDSIKPFGIKLNKQRVISDSGNDEEISLESRHTSESSNDGTSAKSEKLSRKRFISDISNDEEISLKSSHSSESNYDSSSSKSEKLSRKRFISDSSNDEEISLKSSHSSESNYVSASSKSEKLSRNRVISDSGNDEEISLESRHTSESSNDGTSAKSEKLSRKRFISDISNDEEISLKSSHSSESNYDSSSSKSEKFSRNRVISDSSNDEEISLESRHTSESSNDGTSAKSEKLSRKRFISDISNDEEISLKSSHSSESNYDSSSSKSEKFSRNRVISDSSNDEEISFKSTHSSESNNDSAFSKSEMLNRKRLISESNNDENISVKSTQFSESSDDSESIKLDKQRKRKIRDTFEEHVDIESDEDPLDFLAELIEKKRKIQKNDDSKYRFRADSPRFSNSCETLYNPQRKSTQKRMTSDLKTENTANKENNRNSTDTDFRATVESKTINNPLEVSCIANRTRRRKTIKQNQVDDNSKRHDRTQKETRSLDISCIANRTRRKSSYTPKNTLPTISEDFCSESSETYQGFRERLNNVNVSNDKGFSSDASSKDSTASFSTVYSMSGRSLKRSGNQRLRITSLTSDEELGENDAMKNR